MAVASAVSRLAFALSTAISVITLVNHEAPTISSVVSSEFATKARKLMLPAMNAGSAGR